MGGVKSGVPELGSVPHSQDIPAQTPSLAGARPGKAGSGGSCERALIKTPFPFSVVICIRWTRRPLF